MTEPVTTRVARNLRTAGAIQQLAQGRLIERFEELHPAVVLDEDARGSA
jgi:hypothetical protein